MRRTRWSILLTLFLPLATDGCARGALTGGAAADPARAVEELLAADRAFAAASAQLPVADALPRMFAADVVMPTPDRTFARGVEQTTAVLRANAENLRARVTWQPLRGGVSADGRHGFTYGFMTMTRPDSTRAPLKYLAYWVRDEGGWRVAAYKRARRPEGAVSTDVMSPALPPRALLPGDAAMVARYSRELDSTERAFSSEAGRIGLGPAFRMYAAPDAMNMGGPSNAGFVFGPDAIGQAVGGGGPPGGAQITWAPEQTIVAPSGDLGVTIGWISPVTPPESGPRRVPFFTIWRRDSPSQPWRFVAE
jgi:hypothetical protein